MNYDLLVVVLLIGVAALGTSDYAFEKFKSGFRWLIKRNTFGSIIMDE